VHGAASPHHQSTAPLSTKLLLRQDALHDRPGTAGAPPGVRQHPAAPPAAWALNSFLHPPCPVQSGPWLLKSGPTPPQESELRRSS
jgi:hypothetical protein